MALDEEYRGEEGGEGDPRDVEHPGEDVEGQVGVGGEELAQGDLGAVGVDAKKAHLNRREKRTCT